MTTKKLFTTLILLGVIINLIMFLFLDESIFAFAPVAFWAIALFGILKYASSIFKLSSSVKRTKPELYKIHSIGFMLNKTALSDDAFLKELNTEETAIIKDGKSIFKYLFICFGLFALSSILIILK